MLLPLLGGRRAVTWEELLPSPGGRWAIAWEELLPSPKGRWTIAGGELLPSPGGRWAISGVELGGMPDSWLLAGVELMAWEGLLPSPEGRWAAAWSRIASFPRRKVSNCWSRVRGNAWCLTACWGIINGLGRTACFPKGKESACLTVSLGCVVTFPGGEVLACLTDWEPKLLDQMRFIALALVIFPSFLLIGIFNLFNCLCLTLINLISLTLLMKALALSKSLCWNNWS